MSDYIYMLESHLSPDQSRVVESVQSAAGQANMNVFLTGGAMRDMLAGFRIRDLDFVVEGNGIKIARILTELAGAKQLGLDENRKSAELLFPNGVTALVGMSRLDKHGRAGSRPQVSPATIQEDLRGRDFTCNAIALSLNKASRGLLLDPMNGLADIERRELRSISNYGFYDDPSRLLRLLRFRVRLGFAIEERTQNQMVNAIEAEVHKSIPGRILGEELRHISGEDSPSEILKALEQTGMLALFSPALAASKLDLAGIAKFEKNARIVPEDARWRAARYGPFLFALTENLSLKEKQGLVKTTEMPRADVDLWQKLEPRARKLERALRAPRIRKASQVYHLVHAAAPDEVLFLMYASTLKPVQERLRNYFQKYLPAVQEIAPEEWEAIEGKPGTPKYNKARDEFVSQRLDRRPRKPEVASIPPPVLEVAAVRRGR